MIQEVLQLGIKGADIVAAQLQKTQKMLAVLKKPSDIKLNFKKGGGVSGKDLAAVPAGTPEAEKFFRRQEAREAAKSRRENSAADYLNAATGVLNAAGSMSMNQTAGAIVQGIGSLFGATGGAIGGFFSSLLNLEGNYLQAMRGASNQVAQVWAARNQAGRYTETHTGETAKGEGKNVGNSFQIRADMNQLERGQWIASIGRTMGKFSEEYKQALTKLIGNEEQRFDIGQTAELAQGRFSALGSDKGFFMEQIANGFGNMPPSIRQKLTSQLFGTIEPGERARQLDFGNRAREVGYFETDVVKASKQLTSDKGLSQGIQNRQNDSDARLTEMLGKLILVLDKISSSPIVRALPGTGLFEPDKPGSGTPRRGITP